jgi:hypothetical protein
MWQFPVVAEYVIQVDRGVWAHAMVREGAGRQGAVEVALQQVVLRASPLQLGLIFWVALRKICGAG